jgi:hypothetical protein
MQDFLNLRLPTFLVLAAPNLVDLLVSIEDTPCERIDVKRVSHLLSDVTILDKLSRDACIHKV